jgi:hypothetical protein
MFRTKRAWIVTLQFAIGVAFALVALTLPGPRFFQLSLAVFWLMAFSSATHDIAADGFYMLALNKHDQAWFVGVRSTFYRLAMIAGQGLLIMLAGTIETRTGNVPLLRALGRSHGFATHAVAPIHIGPERVSSTRIRAALREGRLGLAAELLGRPYALGGTVVAGRQLGRQLGFPTANIDVSGLELPPHGVYAARANLDGLRHRAVINLGQRPTVDGGASTPLLEVHLLDLRPDLYGRELEVELVAWLRPERRFPSIESLREQISHDVNSAREALG